MVPAAVYARVSTSDKGQEVENQLSELRRFAATQGWEVFHEYLDHESGGKADRAQFQQLLTDAAQRRFDVVLFWALDRFTREGAFQTLQYLNQLTSHGVCYRSFTEPYLDSCGIFREAVVAILGTIAKQERVRLSERVRAGLQRAKAQGRKLGRQQIEVDASKLAALREQGLSWAAIGKQLSIGEETARRRGIATQ